MTPTPAERRLAAKIAERLRWKFSYAIIKGERTHHVLGGSSDALADAIAAVLAEQRAERRTKPLTKGK